jgi:hypothetical protein
MSEKRPHSPNGHVEPADTFVDGSIVLKKQKLGSEIIVGTVTKEVRKYPM